MKKDRVSKGYRVGKKGLLIGIISAFVASMGTFGLFISFSNHWSMSLLGLISGLSMGWATWMVEVRCMKKFVCYMCGKKLYPLVHFDMIHIKKNGTAYCIHCDTLDLIERIRRAYGDTSEAKAVVTISAYQRELSKPMERLLFL